MRHLTDITVVSLLAISALLLGAWVTPAHAATFLFEQIDDRETRASGTEVALRLLVDARDEGTGTTTYDALNALSGRVVVQGPARIVAARTQQSIIGAWMNDPADAATSSQQLSFAGIIPGGFSGVYTPLVDVRGAGEVFRIQLALDAPGAVNISLAEPRVLAHDGRGTALPTDVEPYTLTVGERADEAVSDGAPRITLIPLALLLAIMLTLIYLLVLLRRPQHTHIRDTR